ncbi:MAG: hypothetical protein ABFS05_12440 [Bacteroidota bacterium]
MKKLNILLMILLFPAMLSAQISADLVPFAGYMFGGSINYYEGKVKIDDAMNYGLAIMVPVHDLLDVEVNYTRMQSNASFTPNPYYSDLEYTETSLATNYFHVGGISKFYSQSTQVTPFSSVSLGATWFSPSDASFNTVWRFSANLGLGVKVMFTDRVGIMLRGRLMMPMYLGGVSIYAGTGGSGVGVNTFVTPLQGDFNGGLVISLGGN